MSERLVHLVYVHGFRGNDTTFQTFPTHLQQYLSNNIPSRLNIKFQSSLYPTYKSVKPISFATKNFLEWLKTQPPGPVILIGHSMGGLLVADAATDVSNNPDPRPGAKPRRIVGMIAFDCPYLGMHPHVVVSGLASLFPKGNEGQNSTQTEEEMNPDPNVTIVDRRVADDWDAFKNGNGSTSHSSLNVHSSSSQHSSHSSSFTSLPVTPTPPTSRSSSSSFMNRTLNLISELSDDPLVRWVRKHSDEPFAAGKRWVTEHFQFGSCMFDPSGLKDRYTRLVEWDGLWINYWTITVPKANDASNNASSSVSRTAEDRQEELLADNDEALLESGITDNLSIDTPTKETNADGPHPSTPPSEDTSEIKADIQADPKAAEKAKKAQEKEQLQIQKGREKQRKKLQKERDAEVKAAMKAEKERNKSKVGRHFVVLPTGLGAVLGGGDKWEQVVIGGVQDEVAAHTGLFIPGQNLDYENLVQRVGQRVLEWCAMIPDI